MLTNESLIYFSSNELNDKIENKERANSSSYTDNESISNKSDICNEDAIVDSPRSVDQDFLIFKELISTPEIPKLKLSLIHPDELITKKAHDEKRIMHYFRSISEDEQNLSDIDSPYFDYDFSGRPIYLGRSPRPVIKKRNQSNNITKNKSEGNNNHSDSTVNKQESHCSINDILSFFMFLKSK